MIRPKGVITPERAAVLDETWTQTRADLINAARATGDSRSSWWSLEDMRNYLDYAEAESKELGYSMDGIRVYFGAYPENDGTESAGKSTLFIVPTGIKNFSIENSTSLNMYAPGGDIPGGGGLNEGGMGNPPFLNYPQ